MQRMPVRLRLRGRDLSPFRACGLAGLAAAVSVALALSSARGLSLATELALIGTAIVVFLGLALTTRAMTGRETLVYYHNEIAVLACVAAVAAVLRAPVLAHLDVTAVGLGAFLALGRVGCLLAGCCHGRSARHGVIYGASHADEGFPEYLVDVPLLPVQAIEAAGVAGLVIVCVVVVPSHPGAAFGAYVTGYAVLRFLLEQLRGDPVRRYWHGLSEAQWTSLLVVCAMSAFAALGLVPGVVEHLAAIAMLAVVALAVGQHSTDVLLHPSHVRELAALLPAPRPGRPAPVQTSLGVRLSAGRIDRTCHYTLTRSGHPLRTAEAVELARLISWLRGVSTPMRLASGVAGVYHVVLEDPSVAPAAGPREPTSASDGPAKRLCHSGQPRRHSLAPDSADRRSQARSHRTDVFDGDRPAD
jgi:hypothetical protein